jgi:hypothetical protein
MLGGMRWLALSAVLSVVDVVPHCGGPQVVVRQPGEDCGHHGPRWRGDCTPPAACWSLEEGGTRCTLACATDSDCAGLGADFRCAGARGRPYVSQDRGWQSVCAR